MNQAIQIKQRFKSAVRRGTGEAYLLMQQNPFIDFSADIIKASLKNFAYDGQCEGSRASYVFELISLSGQKEKIRKAVLEGLATEQTDTWSLVQLFDLAKLFAKQNDEIARQAIYDRFLNNPIAGSDWAGYSEILELDGIEGIKFIAEKMGKALNDDPDNWQDGTIISYFQKNNPQIKVMEILEEAGASDSFIKKYLEDVRRNDDVMKNYKKDTPIAKDIVEEILLDKMYSRRFRNDLSDAQLNRIAERLLIEKNINHQEKLLKVFGNFKFPLNSGFILTLASDKTRSKKKVANLAIDALSFLESENIRTFALEGINTIKYPGPLIRILRSNYQKGDSNLLTGLAENHKNEDVIESLAISYIDIYKWNKTKECKEPLEAIYAKLTCAIHRQDIIAILTENDVLSDKIKEEIQFDCDMETRKLAKL